jgi:sortase A
VQLFFFVKRFSLRHSLILILPLLLLLSACTSETEESMEAPLQQAGAAVPAEEEKETAPETPPPDEEAAINSTADSKPVEAVPGSTSQGIDPGRLEIPAIGVDAPVEDVGLDEAGAMEVPEEGELIGWFSRGPKPGAQGNSVLAGHVDDREGPAVFYDLKDLEIGDEIKVHDESGETNVFQVTNMEVYPYDDAPIQTVFGPSASRNLNLITCTGEFDRDAGTHRERLVVFTELVS